MRWMAERSHALFDEAVYQALKGENHVNGPT